MIKNYIFFLLFTVLTFLTIDAQIWTQKADLPDSTRLAPTAFSLNGSGYICCGKQSIYSTSIYYKDLWKYDTQNDSWTQLVDLPGIARSGAISFVFDSSVFVGLGWDGRKDLKDLFRYNLDSNKWDSVKAYPGLGGRTGFGTYLQNKGYYGGGTNGSNKQNDFWEYDPQTDVWTSKGTLPFGKRSNGVAIGLDSLLFMGLGFDDALNMKKDFWSYNPSTTLWTRLADLPGIARVGAVILNFNGNIIVGGGQRFGGVELGDYYQYNARNNTWRKIQAPQKDAFRSFSSSFTVGTSTYLFGGNNASNISLNDLQSFDTDTTVSICDSLIWLKRKSFPDSMRAVTTGFALQGKGYVCCGKDGFSGSGINFYKETWEFDPQDNQWSRVADYPGVARSAAISFIIDSFAYVGLGWDGTNALKDMYKYSPDSNKWSAIANYPGSGGRQGFGTAVNGKGYVAAGTDGVNRHDDFWEYNPVNDTWTRINNFPLGKRSNGPTISMDSLLFIGLGFDDVLNMKKDFWAYNPSLNKWTQIADLPGPARIAAVAIEHNKKVIIGGGHKVGGIELGDYYELNPVTKRWRKVKPMLDSIRTFASSFSLDGSGYVFGGRDQNNNVLVDLWELSDFGFDTTISFAACDSFTFALNNKTYYSSGIFYADTLRSVGCDTIIRLELTVTSSSASSITESACNSFVWQQNGQIYLNSGIFYDTIPNSTGCDSVVRLSLTIEKPVQLINSVSACKEYQWPVNNIKYTQSGTYTDTTFSGNTCDTINTLNLTITTIDTSLSIAMDTLFVTQGSSRYQWLDCNNGFLPIPGATNDYFVASANGNYACEISRNFCADTTICYNVIVTNIEEVAELNLIQISPNPFKNIIYINFDIELGPLDIIIYDSRGRVIQNYTLIENTQLDLTEYPSGLYFIDSYNKTLHYRFSSRIIKQ